MKGWFATRNICSYNVLIKCQFTVFIFSINIPVRFTDDFLLFRLAGKEGRSLEKIMRKWILMPAQPTKTRKGTRPLWWSSIKCRGKRSKGLSEINRWVFVDEWKWFIVIQFKDETKTVFWIQCFLAFWNNSFSFYFTDSLKKFFTEETEGKEIMLWNDILTCMKYLLYYNKKIERFWRLWYINKSLS